LDSTFILSIEQKGKDVVLHVVHANIPDKQIKASTKDGTRSIGNPGRNFFLENRFSNTRRCSGISFGSGGLFQEAVCMLLKISTLFLGIKKALL